MNNNYQDLHCVCPKCCRTNYEITTAGFFEKDTNRVRCSCGWIGIGDDLVAKLTIKDFIDKQTNNFFIAYHLSRELQKSLFNINFYKEIASFLQTLTSSITTEYSLYEIKTKVNDIIQQEYFLIDFEISWKENSESEWISHRIGIALKGDKI